MKRSLSAGLLCLSLLLIFTAIHLTADRYRYAGLCTDDPAFAAIRESRTETGKDLIRELEDTRFSMIKQPDVGFIRYPTKPRKPIRP